MYGVWCMVDEGVVHTRGGHRYVGCVQINLIPSSLAQKIAEISERIVVVIVHNGSHTQLIHY